MLETTEKHLIQGSIPSMNPTPDGYIRCPEGSNSHVVGVVELANGSYVRIADL
jgi:hypothetical protein